MFLVVKIFIYCYILCMNSFDDFVKINGDVVATYKNLAQRYVKIFLNKINAKYVDDIFVKFVKSPFLDVVFVFKINGQIVYLDHEYIKLKSLREQYDSTLANIFDKLSYKEIENICANLTQMLKQKYKKMRKV